MKWIDYREKLGIAFSDETKVKMLSNNMANLVFHGMLNNNYDSQDYYRFCLMTGEIYSTQPPPKYQLYLKFTAPDITLPEAISYYIAFVNSKHGDEEHHRALIQALQGFLNELRIPCELLRDSNGFFVFPKGTQELDDALVSQPLEWLTGYPKAHTAFVKALKEYSEATSDNASNVADKFRKALETFFQEFFGGGRSLEKYVSDHTYEQYLDKCGVPADIRCEFKNTVDSYTKFINNNAKHHDKTELNILEYLMYQTGNIIRFLITLRQEEQTHAN